MSAELCLHGADVWIKTLECQLRNFPGNCITRPPDMKNSSAGRHFPPLSILGTCTSKGKKKQNKTTKAKMTTTETTQLRRKIQQTNEKTAAFSGKSVKGGNLRGH